MFLKRFNILLILVILFIFNSCKENITDSPRVRILIENYNSDRVEIDVKIETQYGNVATGALVYLENFDNAYNFLEFNSSTNSYYCDLEIQSDTNLKIIIDSILFEEKQEYEILYKKQKDKPVIQYMCDEKGNSVFNGENIKADNDFYVSWIKNNNDELYKITIKDLENIIYSSSTNNNSIKINKNILRPGSYYICVEAINFSGDPLFEKYNYYCVSCCTSNNIIFEVQ